MKTTLIISGIILLIACTGAAVLSHPAFGLYRHRQTDRLRQSANWRDGMFRNQQPTPQFTGDKKMLHAMWSMLTDRSSKRVPEEAVPAVLTDLRSLPCDSNLAVWFGHSSYMFFLGGKRFLADPVLKQEFPSSVMMKAFKGSDIYSPDQLPYIDYLIITHEHWDHLDYPTLRELRGRVGHVFCPLGIAAYLTYWGYEPERITEMDWYESSGDAEGCPRVTCLPTRHFSNRLFARNRTLWASFMVEFAGGKVYLGGDGGYDGRFADIYSRFGSVDLAFLENGQYDANWRYIHTMPADLEKAICDLRAKQVFTVHHGKFALAMHPWNEPDTVAQSIAARDRIKLLDAPIGAVVKYTCGEDKLAK